MPDPEPIARQIAQAEQRLADLAKEESEIQARLASLRRAPDQTAPPRPDQLALSPEEKIALFRSRFQGRDDVHALRWESAKTGRSGYSPACANEWVRGICEKRRIRCANCESRRLLPLDDEVIRRHLQGLHTVGLYPLLEDDTCRLLAVDFDGDGWSEDLAAFAEVAREQDLVPLLEVSRSGHGGHAWFFFSDGVQARRARQVGSFLLTRTMERRHQISLQSYDRFFPNQDTLPRGGFGNLIALPLQGESRRQGRSTFLDASLSPVEDPWDALGRHPVIPRQALEEVARAAVRSGRVIGVPGWSLDAEEEDAEPWKPPKERERPAAAVREMRGRTVPVVQAQQLFVQTADLPSPFLADTKRLAAFQNPEFYRRQKMRRSAGTTPRVITGCTEHARHLGLPRGCLDKLEALVESWGSKLDCRDERADGARTDWTFQGELHPTQQVALQDLLEHDTGVLVAPPGSGKTVIAAALAAARAVSTLVLVHRTPLLEQWRTQLARFLGIDPSAIGRLGGTRKKLTGNIDVAMFQTLARRDDLSETLRAYGHVVVDECHHVPAVSFEQVLGALPARFVVGLTATPVRRDGLQPLLHQQCGPVRHRMREAPDAPLRRQLIRRVTTFTVDPLRPDPGIQTLYAELVAFAPRNRMIVSDIEEAISAGRRPIVLTERRSHLEDLAERLRATVPRVFVLHGGMRAKARREVGTAMAQVAEDEAFVVVATGRFIGEGFDDPRLDSLFLALPVAWKGTLIQYVGRIERAHPGKNDVWVHDYVDERVPVFDRMYQKRLKGYEALGYRTDPLLPWRRDERLRDDAR